MEEGFYSIGSRSRHFVDVANSYSTAVSCMVLPIFTFFIFRYFCRCKSSYRTMCFLKLVFVSKYLPLNAFPVEMEEDDGIVNLNLIFVLLCISKAQ